MGIKAFLIIMCICLGFAAFGVSKVLECTGKGGIPVRGIWGIECIDGGCK